MRTSTLLAILSACVVLPALALAGTPATAAKPAGARFDYALHLMKSAENARDTGDLNGAIRLFKEAATEYAELARAYPDWEVQVTRFREGYCRDSAAALQRRQAGVTAATNAPAAPAIPAGTAAAAAPAGAPALADLLAQARTNLQTGAVEAARTILLDALRQNPDDAASRLLIAVAQCRLGNFDDARMVLETLVEEQPSNAPARLALGAACAGGGDLPEARRQLETVLEQSPRDAAAHYNLAGILLRLDPPEAALAAEHYRRMRELGGSADAAMETALTAGGGRTPAPGAAAPHAPGHRTPRGLSAEE